MIFAPKLQPLLSFQIRLPRMTLVLKCIFTTAAVVLLNLYALKISFNIMHHKKQLKLPLI